jgi:hypothetical protein
MTVGEYRKLLEQFPDDLPCFRGDEPGFVLEPPGAPCVLELTVTARGLWMDDAPENLRPDVAATAVRRQAVVL